MVVQLVLITDDPVTLVLDMIPLIHTHETQIEAVHVQIVVLLILVDVNHGLVKKPVIVPLLQPVYLLIGTNHQLLDEQHGQKVPLQLMLQQIEHL